MAKNVPGKFQPAKLRKPRKRGYKCVFLFLGTTTTA
jgi:hypothetical protein